MLYKYRLYNGGRVGIYECDVLDFKNFWKYLNKDLCVWCCCLVGGVGWFWNRDKGWFKCGVEFFWRC